MAAGTAAGAVQKVARFLVAGSGPGGEVRGYLALGRAPRSARLARVTPPRASAAQLADAAVAGVRDDPAARLRLMRALYESRTPGSRHLPYRRAMTAFMRWQQIRQRAAQSALPAEGLPLATS
jgi:hypothetical protein